MPIAVIIAAILTLAVVFQAKNALVPSNTPVPSPTITSTPPSSTIAPSRTVIPTATSKPKLVNQTPSPTPTKKPSAAQYVPLGTPTPTVKVVQNDTEPPVFEWMTGPGDGMTIPWKNFCFPMKINDNSGKLVWIRYSFDSGPGEWNQNFAPCYYNVSNGWHTFVVQAKDDAGNTVTAHSRYFKVDVPTIPNTISPMPTSIVNETQDQ